jgi:hypothetical protein
MQRVSICPPLLLHPISVVMPIEYRSQKKERRREEKGCSEVVCLSETYKEKEGRPLAAA